MDYVYICYTDDEKCRVFSNRDSAIIYCWYYYMNHYLDPETIEDAWGSLMLDLEIEDICYIDCQKVIDGVYPSFTTVVDLNKKD